MIKIKVDLEISQINVTSQLLKIGDITLMKRGKKSYTCFNLVLESDIIFSIM